MKHIITIVLILSILLSTPMTAISKDADTYLSEEIQGYCVEIGKQYGICPELLMSIIETESTGNPKAKNGGCKGLMQISERWHRDRMDRLGVSDIFDPYGNILVGADYLMELAGEHCDIGVVLMKYNGDSKADDFAEGRVPLSKYAEKILTRSAQLERIHGK